MGCWGFGLGFWDEDVWLVGFGVCRAGLLGFWGFWGWGLLHKHKGKNLGIEMVLDAQAYYHTLPTVSLVYQSMSYNFSKLNRLSLVACVWEFNQYTIWLC